MMPWAVAVTNHVLVTNHAAATNHVAVTNMLWPLTKSSVVHQVFGLRQVWDRLL